MRGVLGWRSGLRNGHRARGHGGRRIRKTWVRAGGRGRIRGSWSRNSVWRERRGLVLRRNGHDVSPQLIAAPNGGFRLLLCASEEQRRLFFPIALNRGHFLSRKRDPGTRKVIRPRKVAEPSSWLLRIEYPLLGLMEAAVLSTVLRSSRPRFPCPTGHGLLLGRRRVNVRDRAFTPPAVRRPLSFRAERERRARAQSGRCPRDRQPGPKSRL